MKRIILITGVILILGLRFSGPASAAFMEDLNSDTSDTSQHVDTVSNTAEPDTDIPIETEPEPVADEDAGSLKEADTENLATTSMSLASVGGSPEYSPTSSFSNVLSSFQTDLYTGKATLRVPIQVSPGRRGIQPSLSLLYQSGGPNTWCGTGWLLDTGSIQRSTKKGAPKYDSTDTFVFSFNGSSQELVDIGGNEYRAKQESAFMKFEKNTSYWVVTDKAGTMYYFGQTAASQQQKVSGDIYSWHLDKIIDMHGNYMLLTYQQDENQIYPLAINYTGNEATGATPKYSVSFTLEDRPDTTINYRSGIKVITAKRLKEIAAKYNNSLVRKYLLSYSSSSSTKRSLLTSVTQYGSDGVSSLPAATFDYLDKESSFDSISRWQGVEDEGNGDRDYIRYNESRNTKLELADINGDGLPDRIYSAGDSTPWRVQLNNGSGFDSTISWGPIYVGGTYQPGYIRYCSSSSETEIAVDLVDMNGDGLPDRVIANGAGNWNVQLNNGSGFNSIIAWPGVDIEGNWRRGYLRYTEGVNTFLELADINGDGLPDRIYSVGDTTPWRVQLNNGSGFDSTINWGSIYNGGTYQPGYIRFNSSSSALEIGVDLVDINGDGLPDRVIAVGDRDAWKVQLNNGSGFDEVIDWGPTYRGGSYEPRKIRYSSSTSCTEIAVDLADINGDGLLDRIVADNTSNWKVQINNGSGFEDIISWQNIETSIRYIRYANSSHTRTELIDIDGDGLADRISSDGSNNHWDVQKSPDFIPDLLIKVENGIGGKVDITHTTSTKFDNTGSDSLSDLPFPIAVVDYIITSDGMGNAYTTTYAYENGLYDWQDREFRGFGYVKITDHGGNYNETWFLQDDIYKGKIDEQKVSDPSETLYSYTKTTWSNESLHGGEVVFPYASQVDSYSYDGITKHTRSSTQYGFSGNLIDSLTVTAEGDVDDANDDRTTYTQFSHNTSDWLIGLPYETELKDSTGTTVSTQRIYYDDSDVLGATPTKGLPTKQKAWLDYPTGRWISSSTAYNEYGNVISTTDPRDNSIATDYETTLNQYPLRITNAFSQIQQFTYDYSTGQILTSTDPNNQTTTNIYDTFGRLKEIYGPLDIDGYASVKYQYDLSIRPNRLTKQVKIDYGSNSYITTYSFSDGFGRIIQTKSPAAPVGGGGTQRQIVSPTVVYDYRGKVKEAYQSYFINSVTSSYSGENRSTPKTSYDYDCLGRVTTTTAQNESGTYIQATNSYYGWSVTSTDFKSNVKDYYYDAFGGLIKVTEHNGGTYDTNYTYDTLSNLKRVRDSAGNITTITYDSLGRKISMTDSDMGTWNYAYDDNGNLTSQTDAKDQAITFIYDALNRLEIKQVNGETVTYTYDTGTNGTGRLSRVDYSSGSTIFTYDKLGRETQTTKRISGTDYIVSRTYDALDRLKTLTYPDNEVLTYTYDSSGAVKAIIGLNKDYVKDITYNAQGQMEVITHGNDVTTEYTYSDYTKRLTNLITESPGGVIQNISYQFDNAGNVEQIDDAINTATQSFQYDSLNRLTRADNSAGYGTLNYAYDSIGNLTQKGNLTLTYGESGAGPHAVTSTSLHTMTYDANGNMTAKNSTTYEYDFENRLERAEKPSAVVHDTYEIELSSGWNFFALPVIPDTGYNIADVLSSIDGYYSQVTRYNTTTGKYESYVGDVEHDQFNAMEYLKGYQIYCEASCTLSITGSSPTNTYNLILNPGSNLIGVDITNNGKSASAAFFGIASSSIKWYNPDTDTLETVDADDTVYMGRSYWVDVSANSTYSVGILKDITTFTYDGDGGRVKKSVNGTPTIYVGSLFETNSGISTRHIFLGDTRIASVESAGGVNYYHGDHLGSTSDVTNTNGDLIQHTEYTPYGEFSPSEAVTDDRVTQYLFTGKLLDTSTNLYYYGARYYDPELGRFTQADTIVPDPGNPQAFNRYGYANNNPIRYTDPTGHSFWDKIKGWIGHAVGAIMGVTAWAATGFTNPLAGFQVYSFVSSAINSAISGDIGAFAIGTAASIFTAGFAEGIGLSVAKAVQGIGNEFIQGAIQGAVEFGAAGFIAGSVTEYARTGSGSSALRGGAWGAAGGAILGAAIQGSYMAGWQDVAHGASRAETYAARGVQREVGLYKGSSSIVVPGDNLHQGIEITDNYDEYAGRWEFDTLMKDPLTKSLAVAGAPVMGAWQVRTQSFESLSLITNNLSAVSTAHNYIASRLGNPTVYGVAGFPLNCQTAADVVIRRAVSRKN